MISTSDFQNLKLETLKHFWGHTEFREQQEEVINEVLSGHDVVALLPTGGGKSVCYQLPALLLQGTCLVISPLLALMRDQVNQLKSNGIEAEYLSSELEDFQSEIIFSRCRDNITKLLYVSPERLNNPVFLENIRDIELSFIAVDEAHCISEWGQDFRPSYQNIRSFRAAYPGLACLALTATATPKVLKEITDRLELKNASIYRKSFRRENIKIYTDKIADKYQRIYDLLRFTKNAGLIYTRTRREAEELTRFLRSKNITHVDYYHAGLSLKEKRLRQQHWLQSRDQVLVSTNAFGMGIDKDNVRFVIHYSCPASLENYFQEIGRAGRDGLESYAFLLWNEQEFDAFDQLIKYQTPDKREFQVIVTYVYSLFQIADNDLPEKTFQLHIETLRRLTKSSTGKIRNILNFMHNQELIYVNSHKSLSSLELKLLPDEIDQLPKKDAYFLELLLRNLAGISARKVMFSEANLSSKMGVDTLLLKERIRELQAGGHLEYIDGALASIKFLQHRNDRVLASKYWQLFYQIQKNKLQKWEEMKFYVRNREHCKMRMILSYFGEKKPVNCGKCVVCESRKGHSPKSVTDEILTVLGRQACTADEIAIQLNFYEKEKILEQLILLLDAGKVKMLNFRTYALAQH